VTNDDVDTLATALYVRTDDLLRQFPDLAPWRPRIGLQPRLSDAELVTLAVMQALLATPPKPAGYATPTRIWGTCSATCQASPAITGGCAPPPD
jgi:hypothetical protein